MPKMTMRQLKKSEDVIFTLTDVIIWEVDFSIKLNMELKHARQLLDGFREKYVEIIKSNGGQEVNTPQGKQWGIKPPQPASLSEKATKEDVEKADKEYNESISEYEARNTSIEKAYIAMLEEVTDIQNNKIPISEFKSNFTAYLNRELKGKKFSLSGTDIDAADWFINFSTKKKK